MSAHKLPLTARVTFTQCKGFNEAFFVVEEAPLFLELASPKDVFPLPTESGGAGGPPETLGPGGGGGPGTVPREHA